MDFIKKLWNKYRNWLGDVVWYKNWKIWLSVAIIVMLTIIGDIQNKNEQVVAEQTRIEQEAQMEKEKQEQEELAKQQEEERQKQLKKQEEEKEQKKKEQEEQREQQEEIDQKVNVALKEWSSEYPDAIIDIDINDLVVRVMLSNEFDLLLDSEKQEIITNTGSNINIIAKSAGKEEDVDVIYYNTSNNEIGSYKKTILGDYKTKLK